MITNNHLTMTKIIANSKEKSPSSNDNSFHNTNENSLQQLEFIPQNSSTLEELEEKAQKYAFENALEIQKMEQQHEEHLSSLPIKKRRKYKGRRWRGHSYGVQLIIHTGYLLQCYHFAFTLDGKPIHPSKATLAKQVGICIRTLDKALHALKEMGFLTWRSGKKNFETNTYVLNSSWVGVPMRRPEDFEIPRFLWLKMQYMLKLKKFKKFWEAIYEQLFRDLADHLLRREKYLRTCLLNSSKKFLRKSKDPPKSRGRPLFMGLLKEFKFSMKDNFILSHYGEAPLRAALDDYRFYLLQGKEIDNSMALICSRCKYHRKRLGMEPVKTPAQKFKEFVKKSKRLHKDEKAVFVKAESDINRMDHDKVYIKLMKHKKTPEKSILYLWKRVNGYWVDKCIAFTNERFEELVEPFLKVV